MKLSSRPPALPTPPPPRFNEKNTIQSKYCRTCQTPYLIAKAQDSTACLELLREKHGRPTQEEESFNFKGASAAVALKGGTLQREDGKSAFVVSGETNPEGPLPALFPMGQVPSPVP